jgi:aspartyl-tRNA synthetase
VSPHRKPDTKFKLKLTKIISYVRVFERTTFIQGIEHSRVMQIMSLSRNKRIPDQEIYWLTMFEITYLIKIVSIPEDRVVTWIWFT